MKLASGELYFAGEKDPLDGNLTPLVKIGIVREREGRTFRDRLAEHQTGNLHEGFQWATPHQPAT